MSRSFEIFCGSAGTRRRGCCLLLGLFALCTLPSGAAARGFKDLGVIQAIEAVERGEHEAGLAVLESLVEPSLDGGLWTEARYWAARAAGGLGRYDEALAYLAELDDAMPEAADVVWALRARLLRGARRWAEAREAWQTLVSRYPQTPFSAEARYSVADAYYAEEDLRRARSAYELAYKLFPRDERAPCARYNIAGILLAEGRQSSAASRYRQLAMSSRSGPWGGRAYDALRQMVRRGLVKAPSLRQRLAYVDRLLGMRSLDQAAEEIQALQADYTTASALSSIAYRQAQLAYRERDFETATEVFEELASSRGGWLRYRYLRWLARTHAAAGDFDAAVAIYEGLAETYRYAPEGRLTLYLAAWLAYDGEDHERALALFEKFIGRYPRDTRVREAMWYMAWNAYRLGDLPRAIDVLKALRGRLASDATLVQRAYYWQGRIMTQMGFRSEAVSAFEATTGKAPGYYGVLAQQRLHELASDQRVREWDGSSLLAALEIPPPAPKAPPSEPPRAVPTTVQPEPLPRSMDSFEPDSEGMRRMMRLAKLGHRAEAASVARTLPVREGVTNKAAAFARAELMTVLGDFSGASRIAIVAFSEELRNPMTPQTRRYFRLAYPPAFFEPVEAAASEFGVSPWLLLAVMREESRFHADAQSWASAWGLMQIIPSTGRRIAQALGGEPFNVGLLREPGTSVRFGAWYLAQLIRKFGGHVVLAVGSYNAGPHAMERWVDARGSGHVADEFVEDIPYRETRHYVKRVLASLAIYGKLYDDAPLHVPDSIPDTYQDNVDF